MALCQEEQAAASAAAEEEVSEKLPRNKQVTGGGEINLINKEGLVCFFYRDTVIGAVGQSSGSQRTYLIRRTREVEEEVAPIEGPNRSKLITRSLNSNKSLASCYGPSWGSKNST